MEPPIDIVLPPARLVMLSIVRVWLYDDSLRTPLASSASAFADSISVLIPVMAASAALTVWIASEMASLKLKRSLRVKYVTAR